VDKEEGAVYMTISLIASLGSQYAKLVNQLNLNSQTLVGLADLHALPQLISVSARSCSTGGHPMVTRRGASPIATDSTAGRDSITPRAMTSGSR
jgi:hypothetical protein